MRGSRIGAYKVKFAPRDALISKDNDLNQERLLRPAAGSATVWPKVYDFSWSAGDFLDLQSYWGRRHSSAWARPFFRQSTKFRDRHDTDVDVGAGAG
jgi:hypothetical protein